MNQNKQVTPAHTALPWSCDMAIDLWMRDDHHETAVEITAVSGEETAAYATSFANAELIVRAVNSHAELVAALRGAAQLVQNARQYFPKSMHNSDKFALEQNCAAIGAALARLET